ncbi:MAG: cupin domain-containing protein, partial [Acidimicrobiales bacterium]
PTMEFDRLDSTKGGPPAEMLDRFEGRARLQPLTSPFAGGPPVFAVHFEAGARTRPHVHRDGQLLHIAAGTGVIGGIDGRRRVHAGDVVSVMPGEWHWHGAAPESAMTHLTIQMAGEGSIDWDVDPRDWGA